MPTIKKRLSQYDIENDILAIDDYIANNSDTNLQEIVFLIPAYKERDNIKSVLDSLPSTMLSKQCTSLVIVDGEDDGTAQIAKQCNAKVCIAPVNRGQGAALRIGYKIADRFGAKYIVTVDADGQCDPNDIEIVAEPVVTGICDLVLGSRIKGKNFTKDKTRKLGVTFFARLISFLVGQQLTDTANPLRVMTTGLASSLTLTQNQYQASEVIIDAIINGFRTAERPMNMLERSKGTTKKGKNFKYGINYSKAVLNTYLREKFKCN